MTTLKKLSIAIVTSFALVVSGLSGTSPATAAPKPVDLTATPIAGGLEVSWTDVGSFGTSITLSESMNSGWGYGQGTCNQVILAPENSCTITGLDSTKSYYVSGFSQDNGQGNGGSGWTDAVGPFTPLALETVPGAPTGLGWLGADDQGFTLLWTAPAGSATIDGYVVTLSATENGTYSEVTGGTCASAATSSSTTCTVTGLVNGNYYWAKVATKNSAGVGVASAAFGALRMAAKPSAVLNVQAISHPTAVTLAWTAPSVVGSAPIQGYQVFYSVNGGQSFVSPAEGTCSGTVAAPLTTCKLTGLSASSTYKVAVRTINQHSGASDSEQFDVSTSNTQKPGRPSLMKAKSYYKKLTLTWRAPTVTLSEIPTGYSIQISTNKRTWKSSPAGSCRTSSPTRASLTCSISGLKARTSYWVRVAAKNSSGSSSYVTPVKYRTK